MGNKRKLRLSDHRKNKKLLVKRRQLKHDTVLTFQPDSLKNIAKMAVKSFESVENTSENVVVKVLAETPKKLITSKPINKIEGRRIVDIQYFIKQVLSFPHHGLFSCTGESVVTQREIKKGLISSFELHCVMCNVSHVVHTEEPQLKVINVNGAAVAAGIGIGIGVTQLTEFTSNLNIPPLGIRRYKTLENEYFERFEECALETMLEAGKEEAAYAFEKGHVGKDGVPEIMVVTDGAWCKRTYKTNYDAHSGVACIVGYHTKKILFLGVKNKYCVICARYGAEKEHICFKNWQGTSTSMESQIIVEGFKMSMQLHNLRYKFFIADGDSSVYKKLLEARPYGNITIEKIECKNHLLRNYCTKLRDLSNKRFSSKGKLVPVSLRKCLKTSILRLRVAISSAVNHHIKQTNINEEEKILDLKKDIANSFLHVFGDHRNCSKYFCNKQYNPPTRAEINTIQSITDCGLFDDISSAAYRLKFHAKSLLKNVNNNVAEKYNSILAKFIGGKRVDFSKLGGYEMRCNAAVISNNSDKNFFAVVHKNITGKSPGNYTKLFSNSQERKRKYNSKRKLKFDRLPAESDLDYGPEAKKVMLEVDPEDMEKLKKEFIQNIQKNTEEVRKIEQLTRTQRDSLLWYEERAIRLTASNFGCVCNMRASTNRSNFVNQLLIPTFSGNKCTKYGTDNEVNAFHAIKQILTGVGYNQVTECGLFISESHPFLAASPDGLIGDYGLIEIKCPYSAKELTPEDAIALKKIKFATIENGLLHLKRSHQYYFQVQGQLYLTNRQFCYFVIWTPKGLMYEKIQIHQNFFCNTMLPKLEAFYLDHFLPALVQRGY